MDRYHAALVLPLFIMAASATNTVLAAKFIVQLSSESSQTSREPHHILQTLIASGAPTNTRVKTLANGALALHLKHATPAEQQTYIQQLEKLPQVANIEQDTRLYPASLPFISDTFYAQQSHYQAPSTHFVSAINLPSAWQETTGSKAITVAILDSGITEHPDLQQNLLHQSAPLSGYDFISQGETARDGNLRDSTPLDEGNSESASTWHGTHIAGTIAANSNNQQGITGINWHSQLLNLRILGKGGGYTSDMVDALYWAVGEPVPGLPGNQNPAQVINLSLGGKGACSASLQQAINTATAKGAVIVTAAGNERPAQSVDQQMPANCDNVIVVGALDQQGHYAEFSNFGTQVDLAAPGVHILSTSNEGLGSRGIAGYATASGTSMATAQVSGVIALMLAANPTLAERQDLPTLIEQKIKLASRPFINDNGCHQTHYCGQGMLDAYQAVKAVNTPPTALIEAPNEAKTGSLITVSGTSSYDDPYNTQGLTYRWSQLSGPEVVLNAQHLAQVSFAAPTYASTIQLQLEVTDDLGLKHQVEHRIDIGSANTQLNIENSSDTAESKSTIDTSTTGNHSTASNSGGGGGGSFYPLLLLLLLGLRRFKQSH